MKLLTSSEMRDLDAAAIEKIGIPGIVLMENAGRGAARLCLSRFGPLCPGPVLVLAGKGNNGGDGYVIARCLLEKGWNVRTLVLAERGEISGDAAVNLDILLRIGAEVLFVEKEEELAASFEETGAVLLVDALLGTGLASAVRGLYARAIELVNASSAKVFAVDIPSGVDATCGRVLGRAVRADLTATFAFAKVGHATYPGASFVGDLERIDIGIPSLLAEGVGERHRLVDELEAARLLPPRPASGHKGTFGHLLVVAGSPGKSGAAAMTAEGGLRSGAGLVTVASSAEVRNVLAVKLTEAMTLLLQGEGEPEESSFEAIEETWKDKQALALGPGIGIKEGTKKLLRRLVRECPIPMVLDADGITAIAEKPEILLERTCSRTVLTPHPGEMARLLGSSAAEVETDRIAAARHFAEKYSVVLVLKGARTLVAFPDGSVRINGSGNPGLASGGMGDVLTGLIGGLLAQGMDAESAAVLGVYLHGRAADNLLGVLGDAGMTATDILLELPAARNELKQGGLHAQG